MDKSKSAPKPSLGRIVIFTLPDDQALINGAREHPAIITRVWSETCVNLIVFPDAAPPFVRTSVTPTPSLNGGGWAWPARV